MRRLLHLLALYGFHVLVVRPVLHGLVGVRFRRRHLLPDGPCLIVANHNSHLDAAVLMTMFPLRRLSRVHPVAAADYFGDNWFRHVLAVMCMNGITIERKAQAGRDPLAPAVDALKQGESLIFFPEGSRGEAGVVAPFRRGVGLLVRELPGLAVVPVFLAGPERIWPRGNVVPLPLSIDAHVGRPRTYPATEDPRSIADKVREDVLALAPVPPPVPGKRPAPPARVAVCGVDPERRAALHRAITERLGREGPTLDGAREAAGPAAAGRRGFLLPLLARCFRADPGFVDLVARAQVDEALEHARDVRFAVFEGNPLVELLAGQAGVIGATGDEAGTARRALRYLTRQERIPFGRTPWFLRHAPEVWLITAFDLARPTVPDVLVLVRAAGGSPSEEALAEVAALLRRQRGMTIVEINGEEDDLHAHAERVARACLQLTESAPASA